MAHDHLHAIVSSREVIFLSTKLILETRKAIKQSREIIEQSYRILDESHSHPRNPSTSIRERLISLIHPEI